MTSLTISTTLDYGLAAPADLILTIEAAATREQRLCGTRIDLPPVEHFARVPAEEGIGERILMRLSGPLRCSYEATIEISRPAPDLSSLAATPVHQLPGDAVRYLMASRFCPADRFQAFTSAEFGGLSGGPAVGAMIDWIGRNVAYVPGQSDAGTSALDSFVQRQGVCRDFAHLLITFARAHSIPARMVSAYAPDVTPQDFHAMVELYLDGGWRLVDPTGMAGAEDAACICVGRDAADIAFLTAYGQLTLNGQQVSVRRG